MGKEKSKYFSSLLPGGFIHLIGDMAIGKTRKCFPKRRIIELSSKDLEIDDKVTVCGFGSSKKLFQRKTVDFKLRCIDSIIFEEMHASFWAGSYVRPEGDDCSGIDNVNIKYCNDQC